MKPILVGGLLVALLAASLLGASCGSTDPRDGADDASPSTVAPIPPGGAGRPPLVVDPALDTTYLIQEMSSLGATTDGAALGDTQFSIKTEFAELEIMTPCGQLLGSFTLLSDGTAGITVAGGAQFNCGDSEAAAQRDLLVLLGAVDQWERIDGGLLFFSAEGSSIRLQTVPGE